MSDYRNQPNGEGKHQPKFPQQKPNRMNIKPNGIR